jgi:protein CpxP
MTNIETLTRGKGRKLLLAGLSAVALLGAAAGATHAYAKPHGDGWSAERMEHRADRMLKRVDATPDQLTKVHAIIEAAAKDVAPIEASMSGTHDKMRALLAAPKIDTAAIDALRAQRTAAMDQISVRMTKALEDAANVLTPDQRVKLAAIDTEHAGHHHHDHQ